MSNYRRKMSLSNDLGVLLNSQFSGGVCDFNVQLLSALNNQLSGLWRNVVGNLSAVFSVVHKEHLEIFGVVHKEFVESVGQNISGGLVGT